MSARIRARAIDHGTFRVPFQTRKKEEKEKREVKEQERDAFLRIKKNGRDRLVPPRINLFSLAEIVVSTYFFFTGVVLELKP